MRQSFSKEFSLGNGKLAFWLLIPPNFSFTLEFHMTPTEKEAALCLGLVAITYKVEVC